jgi:C4-dicarboxylate-specific signal transduction histidine kinase
VRDSLPHASGKSLPALIGLSAACLVGAIWFLVLQHVSGERQAALAAAVRDNRNIAVALEQYVSRVLEAQDLAAVHIAEKFKDMARVEEARPVPLPLIDPVASNPLFAAILVTDSLGNVRYASLRDAGPLNVSSRPAFAFLRRAERGQPVISRPGVSPITRAALYSLTRGVRRSDNSFGGTVIVQMPVTRLTALNANAYAGHARVLGIARSDGLVLARRAGNRVFFGEDLRDAPLMRHQQRRASGDFTERDEADRSAWLYSYRRLGSFPVIVFTGTSEAETLAAANRNRNWYYAAAIGLTLALGGLACVIILGFRRTERAARALSDANDRLQMAQRRGRIGDWTLDLASGTVTWSEPLCEMYGRSAEQPVMKLAEALAHYDEKDARKFRQALADAVGTGTRQEVECLSLSNPMAPSVRRILLWPVHGADGAVTAVSGTDQDITKERLNERLRDEVARSSRIELVNLMAATIAHELAQPLTAAGNYLAVAKHLTGQTGAGDAAVQTGKVLGETERQLAVIREIVMRAREMLSRQPAEAEHSRMADIVGDAVALLRAAGIAKEVEIVEAIVDPDLAVLANKIQMQQVVMNLLRNAAQAMAGQPSPRITINARGVGGYGMVCVEDNGCGIPQELDETFSSIAASASGGLGLGLSISKSIVDSYGGSMWIDRSSRACSRICFTVPRSMAEAGS